MWILTLATSEKSSAKMPFDVFLLLQFSGYIIQIPHHHSLATQRRVVRGSSRRGCRDPLMFPKSETHLVGIAASHRCPVKTRWLLLVELPAAVSLQTSIQGGADQEKHSQICYMEQKLDLHFKSHSNLEAIEVLGWRERCGLTLPSKTPPWLMWWGNLQFSLPALEMIQI